MDEVWHGMSLGKNGDDMRRRSIRAEGQLLTAETLASMMGVFGRPYAQWDVYPTWELEEGWRELLSAQHHDNDECEGLCGHVGKYSYDRSLSLSGHVLESNLQLLAKRVDAPQDSLVVFNPLGWRRNDTFLHPETGIPAVVRDLPPMGYKCFAHAQLEPKEPAWVIRGDVAIGLKGDFSVSIDTSSGEPACSFNWAGQDMVRVSPKLTFGGLDTGTYCFQSMRISDPEGDLVLEYLHSSGQGLVEVWFKLPSDTEVLDVTFKGRSIPRPPPGLSDSLQVYFDTGPIERLLCDHPYGVSEVKTGSRGHKKYPTGDWMTSDQWFEEIEAAFTCTSFVDVSASSGLPSESLPDVLIIHDGSQQWFKGKRGLHCILSAYDPWDEDYFVDSFHCSFRLIPHRQMSNLERWQRAQEFRRWTEVAIKPNEGGDLPSAFSLASCESSSALLTSLYRETEEAGETQAMYAGQQMSYPYVARLVEFDGLATDAKLSISGEVASAVKANLLGETIIAISDIAYCVLRPYEIATVYIDVVEGRKQVRDLDAKREVWATVHRVE
jgi:alpha-mannosidase